MNEPTENEKLIENLKEILLRLEQRTKTTERSSGIDEAKAITSICGAIADLTPASVHHVLEFVSQRQDPKEFSFSAQSEFIRANIKQIISAIDNANKILKDQNNDKAIRLAGNNP